MDVTSSSSWALVRARCLRRLDGALKNSTCSSLVMYLRAVFLEADVYLLVTGVLSVGVTAVVVAFEVVSLVLVGC